MVNVDISYLMTKKLVYHNGIPNPFAIYEGMVESIYLINNTVAYSSICSPGVYLLLREFVSKLDKDRPLVIVDDLLGLCGAIQRKDISFPTRDTSIIEQLISLNRIQWQCPHKQGSIDIPDGGIVWMANPLAYLNLFRTGEINTQIINAHKNTTFILGAGADEKSRTYLHFVATYVNRKVLSASVPASLIDNTWAIIPGRDVQTLPSVRGLYLEPVAVPRKKSFAGAWRLENEQSLYTYLYG